MLGGICLSIVFWWRLARGDKRLMAIYLAALGGAFIGAKLAFLAAEGWLYWHEANRWTIFATGKSITGALLGGYAAVEIAKRLVGYHEATGDWFALVAPIGIMLGRCGCVMHGCCAGRQCDPSWFSVKDSSGILRWPAAQTELIFNALALLAVLLLRRRKLLPGQHFHLYLIAYGIFRFVHEFLRDTPGILGPFSGYHVASLLLIALGVFGFLKRRKSSQ
jgi:phosphatidylglycerol:prolipoprotein diacylglycerol transferase